MTQLRRISQTIFENSRRITRIQSFTHDAARVILARIELFPIEILGILPQLFSESTLGTIGHGPTSLDQLSKIGRVERQPFRPDKERGDHANDD